MDTLLKFILYGIAVLVLILVNVWFLRNSVRFLSVSELPDTIAPVRMVGQADTDGRMGQALATMLLARLDKIRQELGASADKLDAPIVPIQQVRSQVVTDPDAFPLPQRLYEPMKLDMKVGGVEVGGIVNWMQNLFVKNDILQFAVENANGQAIVSGVFNDGKQTIWIELSDPDKTKPVGNDLIASAMAYSLAQKQFAKRVPKVNAFDVMEFKLLLDTLNRVATLQKQVELGLDAEADFGNLFTGIEKLLKRTPSWCELTQLAAVLADNGGKPEKAIELYRGALAFCTPNEKLKGELQARIDKLDERLAASGVVAHGLRATTTPARAAWPLDILGVGSTSMPRAPRIAVLGGAPVLGTLDASEFELVGGTGENTDQAMAEYVGTIVQAIRLVAPAAKFVFTPSTGKSGVIMKSDVLEALSELANSKPDILLITMGPLEGEITKRALERIVAQDILVLNAAGNQSGHPVFLDGDPLSKKIGTVASIGMDGKPSKFTQTGAHVLWAPGENIPVNAPEAPIKLRNGTTYSAALAAGVAARVLAEHPNMKPDALLAVLRETAVSHGADQPTLINLAAALKRLQK